MVDQLELVRVEQVLSVVQHDRVVVDARLGFMLGHLVQDRVQVVSLGRRAGRRRNALVDATIPGGGARDGGLRLGVVGVGAHEDVVGVIVNDVGVAQQHRLDHVRLVPGGDKYGDAPLRLGVERGERHRSKRSSGESSADPVDEVEHQVVKAAQPESKGQDDERRQHDRREGAHRYGARRNARL